MAIKPVDYDADFGIDPPDERIRLKAWESACDNRKFEIELYWKRAAYFWALIAAAFAGYFAVFASSENSAEKQFSALALACLGFAFTFAWFRVNQGSKQWQENWEAHVDMLEGPITGPLYKTVLHRSKGAETRFERYITDPAMVSVTKVNAIVGFFTLVMWALLGAYSAAPMVLQYPLDVSRIILVVCMLLVTAGFSRLFVTYGSTDGSDGEHAMEKVHAHLAERRETRVDSQTGSVAEEPSPRCD